MPTERLQKLIARAGLTSRRRAEEWILAGRVRVNGRVVTTLGARAEADRDRIEVDGRRLVFEEPVTFLLHKPRGVVTTLSDPEGRRTVLDLIARMQRRVFPVGRLDYNTAGALLLTNDGELANGLLHPRNAVPRVYRVKVKSPVTDDQIARAAKGVVAEGASIRAARIYRLGVGPENSWLSVTMHHGPAEPVVRLLEAVGLRVMRITRTAFADVTVEGMRPGDYRRIDRRELGLLRGYARLPNPRTRVAPPPPGWDEPPPEGTRGEEDDGTWAAWQDGSVWELFEPIDTPATAAPVSAGVVRRRRAGGSDSRRAEGDGVREGRDRRDSDPPRYGRLGPAFDDDGWDPRGAAGGGRSRDSRREVAGRRPHAFGSGPRRTGADPRDRPAPDRRRAGPPRSGGTPPTSRGPRRPPPRGPGDRGRKR